MRGADAFGFEQRVLYSVDDHQRFRHREGSDVRMVHLAVESRDQLGMADRVSHVLGELPGEGAHPAAADRRLDTVVEGRQVGAALAAHAVTDAADPLRVHLGSGHQVIHRAEVVPGDDAGPGHARGEQGAGHELFAGVAALVELADGVAADVRGAVPPFGGVVGEDHAAFAPEEHVDADDHVTASHQFGADRLLAVSLAHLVERRMDLRAFQFAFAAPEVVGGVGV